MDLRVEKHHQPYPGTNAQRTHTHTHPVLGGERNFKTKHSHTPHNGSDDYGSGADMGGKMGRGQLGWLYMLPYSVFGNSVAVWCKKWKD